MPIIPSSGRAEYLCDQAGDTLLIYVRGEIDHHTAVAIRQGIDATLFEKHPQKLILDLSAVGFMDSSGLGLIMGRLSVMRELGGELTVANPSREVQSILSLAGMERMVHIQYPEGQAPETIAVGGGETPRKRAATRPSKRGTSKERRRRS